MYSIGQFSAISQLSKKMLRFYDEKGLLKPAKVDWETGYRYYDDASVLVAQQIVILKQCGLSLDEIKRMLDSGDREGESAYEILAARRKEIERLSRNMDSCRMRLDRMIQDIAGIPRDEPELARVDAISGLAAECDMEDEQGVSKAVSELFSWGVPAGVSFMPPHLVLRSLDGEDDAWGEGGAHECLVLMRTVGIANGDATRGIRSLSLPASAAITVTHRGSFLGLGEAWKRAFQFAEESRLAVAGYARETYDMVGPAVTIELPVKEAYR